MAKQAIGVGSTANDGNGDALRDAMIKVNSNTDELYTALGDGSTLDDIAKVTGTPSNNQIGVWVDADTLEGDANLIWDGSEFNVTGAGSSGVIAAQDSTTKISMYAQNSNTRGFVVSTGDLQLSPGGSNVVLMATTNDPHIEFQYAGGGFTNGTLHHDDTDFIIGTDDYGANNTRVKLDPSGNTVWLASGKRLGIGKNNPASALDVDGKAIFNDEVASQVETLNWTGAVNLSMANGGIKDIALTGNATVTVTLASGEGVLLHIDNDSGTYDITWDAGITWISNDGSAPTLQDTTDTVVVVYVIGSDKFANALNGA